jgi:hypothetical protein
MIFYDSFCSKYVLSQNHLIVSTDQKCQVKVSIALQVKVFTEKECTNIQSRYYNKYSIPFIVWSLVGLMPVMASMCRSAFRRLRLQVSDKVVTCWCIFFKLWSVYTYTDWIAKCLSRLQLSLKVRLRNFPFDKYFAKLYTMA